MPADLVWLHAVGALLLAMMSEVVYASCIGLMGGAVVGFLSGYARAVQVSGSCSGACLYDEFPTNVLSLVGKLLCKMT